MEIILKQIKNTFVFKLIGNLTYSEKDKIESELWELFVNHTPSQFNFIFDMKSVDIIDTTGVGRLIKYLKIATSHQGDLILANLNSEPLTFLKKCRLIKYFVIYDSVNQAVDHFQSILPKLA